MGDAAGQGTDCFHFLSLGQPFFKLPFLGNINSDTQNFLDPGVIIIDGFVHPGHPYPFAVVSNILIFVGNIAFRMGANVFNHLPQIKAGPILLRHDGANHIFPQDIRFGVAKEILSVLVKENHAARGIHTHYDAIGALDEFAIVQLAFAQRGLGFISFTDHAICRFGQGFKFLEMKILGFKLD